MKNCVLALLIALSAVLGCSAHPPGPSTGVAPTCTTRLRAVDVQFEKPPNPAPRASRLVIELRAPVEHIQTLLAKSIPTTLAQAERQPIGAAGVARYRVERGAFAVSVAGDRLIVAMPVRAHIEVSKGFGPFTVTYGRCDPQLQVTASLSLTLGKDFQPAAPVVTARMTRGCKIAVMDVSSEIEREARRQTEAAERQIRSAFAQIPEFSKQLFVPVSLPLAGDRCLEFRASEFVYELPRIQTGTLVTRVAVLGNAKVGVACAQSRESVTPPPPRVVEHLDPESVVTLQVGWPYDELAKALTAKARKGAPRDGSRIVKVQARSSLEAGRARVALGLDLEGRTCGSAWLSALPQVGQKSRMLEFDDRKPVAGQQAGGAKALLGDLVGALRVTPSPTAVQQVDTVRSEVDTLARRMLAVAQGQTFVEVKLAPITRTIVGVEAGPEQLELFAELRTQAVAEFEKASP